MFECNDRTPKGPDYVRCPPNGFVVFEFAGEEPVSTFRKGKDKDDGTRYYQCDIYRGYQVTTRKEEGESHREFALLYVEEGLRVAIERESITVFTHSNAWPEQGCRWVLVKSGGKWAEALYLPAHGIVPSLPKWVYS